MSKKAALLDKISRYCMYIDYEDAWISVIVLSKSYAITTLHCMPEPARVLGLSVPVVDRLGKRLQLTIHGIHEQSDYAVFKIKDGEFLEASDMVCPEYFEKYLVVGYDFGERKPSVRMKNVSSLCSTGHGYFYGDSGGLPGLSGGGVFYARNGALMGIARGDYWNEKETNQYADVLKMISAQGSVFYAPLFRSCNCLLQYPSARGALVGIAKGDYWNGMETYQNADVSEMISVQAMLITTTTFRNEPSFI